MKPMPVCAMRLDGKTMLITGAGSGIGRALAVACAEQGARLLLVGRRRAKLEETRALLDPPGKTGPDLVARAHEHGLIVRALGDRIAFSPPLIISDAEIDRMFDRFAAALDETG